MKITIISDTHGQHDRLPNLQGDVLVHCGDFGASLSDDEEVLDQIDAWFAQQDFTHILCTGGNHDFGIQQRIARNQTVFQHARYLQDEAFEFQGIRFYGAPWIPDMTGWPFYLGSMDLARKWALIPENTDVLITHTPPYGILDMPRMMRHHAGCRELRPRVAAIRPRIHCFGHIHASYGRLEQEGTEYINASTASGTRITPPVIIELPDISG